MNKIHAHHCLKTKTQVTLIYFESIINEDPRKLCSLSIKKIIVVTTKWKTSVPTNLIPNSWNIFRFHCLLVSKKQSLLSSVFFSLLPRFTELSSLFSLPVSTALRTAAFSWKKSTFLRFWDLMNIHHLNCPLLFC